jgi:hypothetical protein
MLVAVAVNTRAQDGGQPRSPATKSAPAAKPAASELDYPIQLARASRDKYRNITDYTCLFVKRERIEGELLPMEFIEMKVRARPFSVYMHWRAPYEGREVLYVDGANDGKIIAHETGIKAAVGSVDIDPFSGRAMKNNRHPITEAGLGKLIERIVGRWEQQRQWGQTRAVVLDGAKVEDRVCWCVKTVHPYDPRRYQYYRSRIFIDKENGMPIRVEAYDWPRPGSAPDGDLLEEYTYTKLRLNARLTALDFSVNNPNYRF